MSILITKEMEAETGIRRVFDWYKNVIGRMEKNCSFKDKIKRRISGRKEIMRYTPLIFEAVYSIL